MITIFTICSNNYLAQAKTLGDNLTTLNPGYHFVICLVDNFSDKIDYSFFSPYEIIPITQLGINDLPKMTEEYNVTELNTAVKPFVFNFLFLRNTEADAIIYFDPDILTYQPLTHIEQCFTGHDIIITPHFFLPINDNYDPDETDILNAGLYNLGFIAVKRSEESLKFLSWWMKRLSNQCRIDFANGLFVDQLWVNFVPLYFKKVLILEHLGHNMAYWNFHERKIDLKNGVYFVNEVTELVFFHFSGYNLNKPGIISKYQNRFSFSSRPDILPLFKEYRQKVLENQYNRFILISCYYRKSTEKLISKKTGIERLAGFLIKVPGKIINKIRGKFN